MTGWKRWLILATMSTCIKTLKVWTAQQRIGLNAMDGSLDALSAAIQVLQNNEEEHE